MEALKKLNQALSGHIIDGPQHLLDELVPKVKDISQATTLPLYQQQA